MHYFSSTEFKTNYQHILDSVLFGEKPAVLVKLFCPFRTLNEISVVEPTGLLFFVNSDSDISNTATKMPMIGPKFFDIQQFYIIADKHFCFGTNFKVFIP